MKQLEYKHVRMTYGWAFFSKEKFNDRLLGVLEPLGRDGWELKGILHEGIEFHIHMIFARELSETRAQQSSAGDVANRAAPEK